MGALKLAKKHCLLKSYVLPTREKAFAVLIQVSPLSVD